jgi:glucose-1-phosphate cytidylyltransferase
MKVVILAGGFGKRLSEETDARPKPMVEVGGIPLLLHIMTMYHAHGFSDFIVAGGYKVQQIKSFFANLALSVSDIRLDLRSGFMESLSPPDMPYQVSIIDTGLATLTGGRLKRLARHLGDESFMMTYGDGVADIDLGALLRFHRAHGRKATVTAVRPPARFGALTIGQNQQVLAFEEKRSIAEPVINGGFFVFEPSVLDYLDGDDCVLEGAPLARLASEGELFAYAHQGFWKPMDTLRDLRELEQLWESGQAPWKRW